MLRQMAHELRTEALSVRKTNIRDRILAVAQECENLALAAGGTEGAARNNDLH